MSLLNEALQRAEEDKRRRNGAPPNKPSLLPAGAKPKRHGLRPARIVSLLIVIAVAAALGWALLDRALRPFQRDEPVAINAPATDTPTVSITDVAATAAKAEPTVTTAEPAQTDPKAEEPEKVDPWRSGADGRPVMVLNGIIHGDAGRRAVINNQIVHEGQIVSGVKIVNIGRGTVTIEYGGQRDTLRL